MGDNRCLYCEVIIPEGRQVCPNCEQLLLSMEHPEQAVITDAAQTWDGGTLKVGDVVTELGCTRHEAQLILDNYGFDNGVYAGIGLRTLRLHQLNGDIADLLSKSRSGDEHRIAEAIRLLQSRGFKVVREMRK